MPCWTRNDIIWAGGLEVGEGFIATFNHSIVYKVTRKDDEGVHAVDKDGDTALFDEETDVVRAERCPTCRQIKLTGIK